MEDNIILAPVKCKCGKEFFIKLEPQKVTCPGCGITDEIVCIDDDE